MRQHNQKKTQKPLLLITGASGRLAQLTAQVLKNTYSIVGVDPRPLGNKVKFPGIFKCIDNTKRDLDEIFRRYAFESVLHLGRIKFTVRQNIQNRFDHNVKGTHHLFHLVKNYDVKHLLVMGTYHVYGAHADNYLYLEEEAPLRGGQMFPELVDAIEIDHMAQTMMWRSAETSTTLLRPANIIGPKLNNAICRLLKNPYCPKLLGYDPLMQFVHEQDMVQAIQACLIHPTTGIYNLAGEGPIPYSAAIRLVGSKALPVPYTLLASGMGALAKTKFPFSRYLLDYFRYPTVISDRAFRRYYQFSHEQTLKKTLLSLGHVQS